MFSANADGMNRKGHSLKHEIKESQSSIFTIQETKFKKKERFKLDEFIIFESIRKNKEKGGTMLGIHQSLEPVLIEEYDETFELIVAEFKVIHLEVRIITGYGPQESWKEYKKNALFCCTQRRNFKSSTSW